MDISIYKDEDQLKELERKKKRGGKKASKSSSSKQLGPKATEGNLEEKPSNTEKKPTAKPSKKKDGTLPEAVQDKVEERKGMGKIEEDEIALSTKRRGRPPSKAANAKAAAAARANSKSHPSTVKDTSTKVIQMPAAATELPAKGSRKNLAKRVLEEGKEVLTDMPTKGKVDKGDMTKKKDEHNKNNKADETMVKEKLPAKLANKNANKQQKEQKEDAKEASAVPIKEKNNETSSASKTDKIASKQKTSQKRKRSTDGQTQKQVFDFEDDFEEEVMPIPKKRAVLKSYPETNQDDSKKETNTATAGNASKRLSGKQQDVKNGKEKQKKATEPLKPSSEGDAVASSKKPEAQKPPPKRGRGRSKK